MILIISTCREALHELEFVKPVVDILEEEELLVTHYADVSGEELERSERVIICGTSLQDDGFVKDIDKFSWIKDYDKPVLGICAGSQILGLVFGGELKEGTEIGYYKETFNDFLDLDGEQEVFHLHNHYVAFSVDFDVLAGKDIPQAVTHRTKPCYGVLFHPEVRQKGLIKTFAAL